DRRDVAHRIPKERRMSARSAVSLGGWLTMRSVSDVVGVAAVAGAIGAAFVLSCGGGDKPPLTPDSVDTSTLDAPDGSAVAPAPSSTGGAPPSSSGSPSRARKP